MRSDSLVPSSGPTATNALTAAAQLAKGKYSKRFFGAALMIAASYDTVRAPAKATWDRWTERNKFVVSVPSTDDIYDDLHEWLLRQIPDPKRRALKAKTYKDHGDSGLTVIGETDRRNERYGKVALFYDGSVTQTVRIGGHRVEVEREQDNRPVVRLTGGSDDRSSILDEREMLKFTSRSPAARDAVVAFLSQVAHAHHATSNDPRYYMASRWGGWNRREDLPKRSIETVILRDGLREQIVRDIERFMELEPYYSRLDIPWHRGYLFHGPPGTGKTSLARALASYFDFDVHVISLADTSSDSVLLDLMRGIEPRSLLVLEDVDIVTATHDRDEEHLDGEEHVTLSGLLNALDGLGTPHGLVTVMTTNFPDKLDDALVRPGRVDRSYELGVLDDDQLLRLVTLICGDEVIERNTKPKFHATAFPLPSVDGLGLVHAEVVEWAKPYLDRPYEAYSMVSARINHRRKRHDKKAS